MKIIFCGGPRGAGKSTLIRRALTEFPEIEAIHINKVLLECERRGITPEQYVKQAVNGKAAMIVDGRYAHIPRDINNPTTAATFHLGVENFPSASCFVFVYAHEKELDQRIKSDIKKRRLNPRDKLAEWIAMRHSGKIIHHVDSSNYEAAYSELRKIIKREIA